MDWMTNNARWAEMMMSLAKQSFLDGLRQMDVFHGQAEKTLEMTVRNTQMMREEILRSVVVWMEQIKAARHAYGNAIASGMEEIGQRVEKGSGSEFSPQRKKPS